MGLHERLSAKLDGLSPKLRQAGAYVVKHPEEIATRSLRHIARQVDMSAPTLTRLAQALGYTNYEAMRDDCRAHLKQQELRYASKARALQDTITPEDAGSAFIVQQGKATISNIGALLNAVDPVQLERAAEHLGAARKVVLVGMMSSRPFVDYVAYVASMAFDNWRVLGGQGGSDAALLCDVGPEDTALVISKSPYATRAIDAARLLKSRGTFVVGITDDMASPLCQHCESVFFVSTDTPQFFTSHAATLVLLETLIGLVVANGGAQVRDRIRQVQTASYQQGEYCKQKQ